MTSEGPYVHARRQPSAPCHRPHGEVHPAPLHCPLGTQCKKLRPYLVHAPRSTGEAVPPIAQRQYHGDGGAAVLRRRCGLFSSGNALRAPCPRWWRRSKGGVKFTDAPSHVTKTQREIRYSNFNPGEDTHDETRPSQAGMRQVRYNVNKSPTPTPYLQLYSGWTLNVHGSMQTHRKTSCST